MSAEHEKQTRIIPTCFRYGQTAERIVPLARAFARARPVGDLKAADRMCYPFDMIRQSINQPVDYRQRAFQTARLLLFVWLAPLLAGVGGVGGVGGVAIAQPVGLAGQPPEGVASDRLPQTELIEELFVETDRDGAQIAQFDEDELDDRIVRRLEGRNLFVEIHLSGQAEPFRILNPVPSHFTRILVYDIDHDNDSDLIIQDLGGSQASRVWLGDGKGNLRPSPASLQSSQSPNGDGSTSGLGRHPLLLDPVSPALDGPTAPVWPTLVAACLPLNRRPPPEGFCHPLSCRITRGPPATAPLD